MSRDLGPILPDDLRRALSQSDLAGRLGRVLPLITVDAGGHAHPMLCTYVEVRAESADTVRVVIGAASSSARNLSERRVATLLIVEPERTVYVKGRAAGAPLVEGTLARFDLRVEHVLEDSALDWEGAARITSGIVYGPVPALDAPEAQATRELLRRPAR